MSQIDGPTAGLKAEDAEAVFGRRVSSPIAARFSRTGKGYSLSKAAAHRHLTPLLERSEERGAMLRGEPGRRCPQSSPPSLIRTVRSGGRSPGMGT